MANIMIIGMRVSLTCSLIAERGINASPGSYPDNNDNDDDNDDDNYIAVLDIDRQY
jgi:hypothetical protein